MGCQIKIKNGSKTYLNPKGTKSNLYSKISKFTSNSSEADLVFKNAYNKDNIEVDENLEPVIKDNKFSDGSPLYPRKAVIEFKTLEKLWEKIDGDVVSEFTKEVKYDKEIFDYLKDIFTVSKEFNGKFIVTKQGPAYMGRKLKAESNDNYSEVMSKIKDFLFETGVSVQAMNTYLSDTGYRNAGIQNAKGLADTSLRIIALTTENGKTLAEEAAHMGVDFYSNQAAINKALPGIVNSPLYKEKAEHYRGKYKVFGLSEVDVEHKVRKEILAKYVGLAIENNTYPKGFRGLIISIINKIKGMFRPEYKNMAEKLAADIRKADKKNFAYVPTGEIFFDSSQTILEEMKEKFTQYMRVLKKDWKNPNRANRVINMLTAINDASKNAVDDKAGLTMFVQKLVEDTSEVLGALQNRDSLNSQELKDLSLYFSYYRPYIFKIKDLLPDMKDDLTTLSNMFSEMDNIRHNFMIDEALVHVEKHNKEGHSLKSEFAQMSVDSGFLGRWLASGADSANPIARIFHIMITKIMHKVNSNTIEYGRGLLNFAEDLGITNTDFLFHRDGKNFTGKFIRPFETAFKLLTPNQKKFAIRVENNMTAMYNQVGLKYEGLAPQMSANILDVAMRANEKTMQSIGLLMQDSILANTNDDVGFYKAVGSRPDGTSERIVPRYYTNPLDNPNLITNDAIRSLIAFKKMAENYEQMSKEAPVFENILESLGLSTFKKGKNLDEGVSTNDYAKMKTMLDMFVYGESKEEVLEINWRGKVYSASKMLDKLKRYVTNNNLGSSVFTQAAGFISAKVFVKLDSYLEEHSSSKSQKFARRTLPKYYSQAAAEIGSKNKKSILNIILQDLGVFGDSAQIFENLNKNRVTRIIASNPTMSGFALANFSIKSNVTLAALDHYRLYKDAVIKPTHPDYEKGKPLHEFLLNKKMIGSTTEIHKDNMAYIGMIIQNQVDTFEGGLSHSDKTAAQQNAYANLVLTHKSWIVRGLSKRFRTEGYNYVLDKEDVGYMRATSKFLSQAFNAENVNMFKYMLETYPTLPKLHQIAVKKALLELGLVLSLVGVASILNNLFEDDEEGLTPYALYLFNRSYLELSALSFPFGIPETFEVIKNPFVATGQMQQLLDIFQIFDTEEVESGPYKGLTKGRKTFYKLIPGVKGYFSSIDPKYQDRWLKQGALKYSLWFQGD